MYRKSMRISAVWSNPGLGLNASVIGAFLKFQADYSTCISSNGQ